MKNRSSILQILACFIFIGALTIQSQAQNVKRIVIIKTDGTPGEWIDRYVRQRNPETGKSLLPWFEEVFYKKGTRLENFYARGMSLSGPSWSILDTGQHLQIKGNVEYDRLTLHSYDYLNFFPYYIDYGLNKVADMPAVEVLNQLKIPILSDAFPFEHRYTSPQLIQRGNSWKVLGNGFIKFYPRNVDDFIDEWTIGFEYRNLMLNQNERDIIYKLNNRPYIEYFDYYTTGVDHTVHHNNDEKSRINALQDLDRAIGRIWTAIESSPGAEETALVVLSDHGFNSNEKAYSQGFNIVKLLASGSGGGHHVVTKRRLMLDYSVKGAYPLVPLITTTSKESLYLKKEEEYPTALVDFDGNERTSFHLRNSDLNTLQILFQELQKGKLSPNLRKAATESFFQIIERHRAEWTQDISEMSEEMDALHRWINEQQAIIANHPKEYTPEEYEKGVNRENRRMVAQTNIAIREEKEYREYLRILSNLLSLRRESFNPKKIKIEDYIGKGVMGKRNSVYQLQNYIIGLSAGLVANANGEIDFEKSFKRVNYFKLLERQTVRNNVQTGVSNRPIDFAATSIPPESLSTELPTEINPDEPIIWLYGSAEKQALILTRKDENGEKSLRYLPISNLQENAAGKFSFQIKEWREGFPLKIFEDENLVVPLSDKTLWLNSWHTEDEWMNAVHKTFYSNGIISLNEQFANHPLLAAADENMSSNERLIIRFRQRQRSLTENDLLVLANYHWNFDVRGFNPGGNHGSFFRVSTNSTLMFAGGAKTNIPKGLVITKPFDSLSFVPTVLRLTGKVDAVGNPIPELYEKGFRKFPGKIIDEVIIP